MKNSTHTTSSSGKKFIPELIIKRICFLTETGAEEELFAILNRPNIQSIVPAIIEEYLLPLAIQNSRTRLVEKFLDKLIDHTSLFPSVYFTYARIYCIALNENQLEIAKLLLEYIENKAKNQGVCLLPQIRDLESIRKIFQYHPDKAKSFLQQADNKGNSAFELIVTEGLKTELKNTSIIRELLTRGADINIINKIHGSTLLLEAIANTSISEEAIRKFIHLGADPNQSSESNKLTPLIQALESFRPSIVRLLLAIGAIYSNPTITYTTYPTPLFYQLALIKRIIYGTSGASLSAELVKNIYEIVDILVDYETAETLSAVNDKNETILEIAINMCMANLTSKLILKGCHIHSEKIIARVTELLINFKKQNEMGSYSHAYYQDFFQTIVVLLQNKFPLASLDAITRNYLFRQFLPQIALAEIYVKVVNQQPLSENAKMLKAEIETALNNNLAILLPYIEKLNNDDLHNPSYRRAMLQILKYSIENPVSKATRSQTKKNINENINTTLSIILDSCTILDQESSFELMKVLIKNFGVRKVLSTLLSSEYNNRFFHIELCRKTLLSNQITQQDLDNSDALNLVMKIAVEETPQETRGEFLRIAKLLTEKFSPQESDETRKVVTFLNTYYDDKENDLTKDKEIALKKEFYPILQSCKKSKSKFISIATLIFNGNNSHLFNQLITYLSKGPLKDELKILTKIALSLWQVRKNIPDDTLFIVDCLNKIANLKIKFSIYLPSDDINNIFYLTKILESTRKPELISFIIGLGPNFNLDIPRTKEHDEKYVDGLLKIFQQFGKIKDLNTVSILFPELLRTFGWLYLSHYIIALSELFAEYARPFAYSLLKHASINSTELVNQKVINKLASFLDDTQLIDVLPRYQDTQAVFQLMLEKVTQHNRNAVDVVIQRLSKHPIILKKYTQTLSEKQKISLSAMSIDILLSQENVNFSDEISLSLITAKGYLLNTSSFTTLAGKNYDNNQRYRLYEQYYTENSERLAILERSFNLKNLFRIAINHGDITLATSLYRKIDHTLKVNFFYEMLLNQANTDKFITFISKLEEDEIDFIFTQISNLKEKALHFSVKLLYSNNPELFLKYYKKIKNYAQFNNVTKNKLLDFFARNNLESPFFSVLAEIDVLPDGSYIDQFLHNLKFPSLSMTKKNSIFFKIVRNKNSFDRLLSSNKELTILLVREKFPDELENKEHLLSLLISESGDLEINDLFEMANDKNAFLQCGRKSVENFTEEKKYRLYSMMLRSNILLTQEEFDFLKEKVLSRKDFAILLLAFPNELTLEYVAKNDPHYDILTTLVIHNYTNKHHYELKAPDSTIDLLFDRIIELRKVVSPRLIKLIAANYSRRLHTTYDVMQTSCPKDPHGLSQQFLRRSKQFLNEFNADFSLPIQENSDKKFDPGLYNSSLIHYISRWNKLMLFMSMNNPENLKYIEQILLSIDAHPGMLIPTSSFSKHAAAILNCLQKQQAKYESPIYYGGSSVDVLLHKSLASNFEKKNDLLYETFLSQSDLDITIEVGDCANDAAFELRFNEIIHGIHQKCSLLPDKFPLWNRDKTTGKRYCNIKYLSGLIDMSVSEAITPPVTTLTTKINYSYENYGKIIYCTIPQGKKHPLYQLVENTFSLNPEFNLSLVPNDTHNDAKKSLWHFVLKTIIRARAFDIELDNENLTMLQESIQNNSVFFYLVMGWYVNNIFVKNTFGVNYQQELLNAAAKIKLNNDKTVANLINNILIKISASFAHAAPVYEQITPVNPVAYNPTSLLMYGRHTSVDVAPTSITQTQEIESTLEKTLPPGSKIISQQTGNSF